jgi:hypothetical protein
VAQAFDDNALLPNTTEASFLGTGVSLGIWPCMGRGTRRRLGSAPSVFTKATKRWEASLADDLDVSLTPIFAPGC